MSLKNYLFHYLYFFCALTVHLNPTLLHFTKNSLEPDRYIGQPILSADIGYLPIRAVTHFINK